MEKKPLLLRVLRQVQLGDFGHRRRCALLPALDALGLRVVAGGDAADLDFGELAGLLERHARVGAELEEPAAVILLAAVVEHPGPGPAPVDPEHQSAKTAVVRGRASDPDRSALHRRLAHCCTFRFWKGAVDRFWRAAAPRLPCLCEEGQARLLPDSPNETRPLAETGRPRPATGCRATGQKAFETQPPERRPVSDRQSHAGALELWGDRYDLPPVYSTHNSYVLWGPPPAGTTVAVVLGDSEERLRELFEEVEHGVVHDCDWCMRWRDELPIRIVRGPRIDLRSRWYELRHFE